MRKNRAQGIALTDLDVVVVDDSKPIQAIVRTMLNAARVARVRVFDGAAAAYDSMMVETPHLLITDWNMPGTDGLSLVRRMRDARTGALATVPAILITGHATRDLVETSIAAGVHFVLVKPLSPANVLKRIEAVITDPRQFVIDERTGLFVLDDRDLRLSGSKQRHAWTDRAGPALRERLRVAPARVRREATTEAVPDAPARPRSTMGLSAPIRGGSAQSATGQPPPRTA
ncbi:response regulator [Siculibacillus lacustris]|nr:response regulator [Siculibacillus lacustris]